MPDTALNLIKGDKVGVETDYRDYLPVNMSGIVRPLFGASGYMLQQPGLTQYGRGEGIDRGGVWNARFESIYRVSGNSFIEVFADGSTTVLGAISGADTVSLPYSFNTQAVIADGKYYLYDPVGGFREVTDPDLGDPIDAVWVDGVYFFTDGEFIYHTNIADEEAIDPLKFATAEFMPDPSLGVYKTTDNKVGVIGRESLEYFVNAATANFSFARVDRRALKIGAVGTHAKAEMLDKLFIMGGRANESVSVFSISGGSVTNIASREVDKLIGQYTEEQLSTSVLEARVEDDYSYMIVHLPNETLLYNAKISTAAGKENAWSIISSDEEFFNPAEIENLSLWLDAADSSSITEMESINPTEGDVSAWFDKSGNGSSLSESTPINRPTYLVPDINGLNTVGYDGINDTLFTATQAPELSNLFSAGGTVIGIIKPLSDGASNVGRIFDWALGARATLRDQVDSNAGLRFVQSFTVTNGIWVTANMDVTLGIAGMFAITYDASSIANEPTFYINRTVVPITEISAPSGLPSDDSGGTFAVGNRPDATRSFDGSIGELIFYKAILEASELNSVFDYLSSKWGV